MKVASPDESGEGAGEGAAGPQITAASAAATAAAAPAALAGAGSDTGDKGGDGQAAPPRRARKATPTLIAQGLEGPERRVPLSYSAPSVDGDTTPAVSAEPGAKAPEKDGITYPGTPRNAQCPCGSGKKYKVCHGKNEA
ncbi:SEC-C metal-binding domain-containing protein [Actinotalea sp. M2MS4P-6]|uniref:SEC-C metal-binding domain-containing protein n=1 Tax=Actinotalea sp. M2MS4P-6 TaxID=2983762 RepID=UPI00398C7C2D